MQPVERGHFEAPKVQRSSVRLKQLGENTASRNSKQERASTDRGAPHHARQAACEQCGVFGAARPSRSDKEAAYLRRFVRREFQPIATDVLVLGDYHSAPLTHLREPLDVGAVLREVVVMGLDLRAGSAQGFRHYETAELPVNEKSKGCESRCVTLREVRSGARSRSLPEGRHNRAQAHLCYRRRESARPG